MVSKIKKKFLLVIGKNQEKIPNGIGSNILVLTTPGQLPQLCAQTISSSPGKSWETDFSGSSASPPWASHWWARTASRCAGPGAGPRHPSPGTGAPAGRCPWWSGTWACAGNSEPGAARRSFRSWRGTRAWAAICLSSSRNDENTNGGGEIVIANLAVWSYLFWYFIVSESLKSSFWIVENFFDES